MQNKILYRLSVSLRTRTKFALSVLVSPEQSQYIETTSKYF